MGKRRTEARKRVTITDVAQEAGVSIAAVSRILNNSYDGFSAREETKQRVYDAVRKLGYRANRSAVRLATGRHQAIGFCYPQRGDFDRPVDASSLDEMFAQLAQMLQAHGAARAAAAVKHDLLLMMRGAGRSLGEILRGAEETVDGVVVIQPEDDPEEAGLLQSTAIPTAVVGGTSADERKVCVVRVDEFTAGRMAMGHLIVAGSRRIVVAAPEGMDRQAHLLRRLEGVQAAVRAYNDPKLGFDVLKLSADPERAQAAFVDHMGRWGRPDGVLSLGGALVFPILRAAAASRLRVPADLKVAGFDENPMFALHDPPITGIRYPIEEMCKKATEMLLHRLGTGDVPPAVVMTPRMIARRSSEASFAPFR